MGTYEISAAEPPEVFARRHFGQVGVGDLRLTARAVKVAAAAARCPEASIPRQSGDKHQSKGAYRFFQSSKVTSEKITQPHRELTMEAAREHPVVLFVQDTTHLSFAPPEGRSGLGPIGANKSTYGLLMHATLAMTPGRRGSILGLGDIRVWSRNPTRRKKASKEQRRTRKDRESLRWSDVIESVGAPPDDTRFVHVADREADVWETFVSAANTGSDCLIRACGSAARRKASLGHIEAADRTEAGELASVVRALPASGKCEVTRAGGSGRAKRTLHLSVAFAPVTLHSPRAMNKTEPVQLWAVRMWEEESGGTEPVDWVLLTSVPVLDVTDAMRIAEWYQCRWTIEEYFKCLKTGCRIEQRQLQEGERLDPLIGMFAIIALRLINTRQLARLQPQAPATDVVPQVYVTALSKCRGIPEDELTCERFWRETAMLGGFMGRKSDGNPGWQTLWHGWRDLQLMVEGAKLFAGQGCG